VKNTYKMAMVGDEVIIYVPSLGFISATVVDIYRDVCKLHSSFGEYHRPTKDLIHTDCEIIREYQND